MTFANYPLIETPKHMRDFKLPRDVVEASAVVRKLCGVGWQQITNADRLLKKNECLCRPTKRTEYMDN